MMGSRSISQRLVIAVFAVAIIGLIGTAGALTVSRVTEEMSRSAD